MNSLTGPWEKTDQGLHHLSSLMTRQLKLAMAQNAELIRKTLVKHLQNQDLPWKELSPKYLQSKKKRHLSHAILIATSQLMQSVTTQLSSNKLSAFVGVLRSGRRKDGEPPVLIAEIHEFGSKTRRVPARPLFRPTFREMQSPVKEGYRKAVLQVLESLRSSS